MKFIFIMLALLAGPFIGGGIFKQKFGAALSVSLGMIMTILYVFYVLDYVVMGFYVITSLLIIGVIAALICLITGKTSKNELIDSFFSTGFFVFVILCAVYRVYVADSTPILWDELRLWGVVPKAIFLTERLQLGSGALIFDNMQSYYPGIGLLQYFFENVHGSYSDYVIFFIYAVLGASFTLPVCDKFPKRPYHIAPICSVFIFLLPLTFYNQGIGHSDFEVYYKTLFIDGLLGFAVAGSLLALLDYIYDDALFNLIRYIISICILMLLKESGMLFAFFSIMLLVISCFKYKRDEKKNICVIIGSLIALFGIKLSWSKAMAISGVHATGGWLSGKAILEMLTHMTVDNKIVIKNFCLHLFNCPLLPLSNWGSIFTHFKWMFSWASLVIVYFICTIYLYKTVKDKKLAFIMIGAGIADVIYQISLLLLFTLSFNDILSYVRYTNTGIIAIYAILFVNLLSIVICKNKCTTFVLCAGIISILIFPFYEQDLSYYTKIKNETESRCYNVSQKIMEDYSNFIIYDSGEDTINVFFMSSTDLESSIYHLQFYCQLMNDKIIVRNGWMHDLYTEGDPKEYLQSALNGCDYLYVSDKTAEDNMRKIYSGLVNVESDQIVEDTVYRIECQDDNIKLILCE